jgi:hypothetical protein
MDDNTFTRSIINKELCIRKYINNVKYHSYNNPQKNNKIKNEANNAFSRLLMILLSFSSNHNLFNIEYDPHNKIDVYAMNKWEKEMKEKGIDYNKHKLIHDLNSKIRVKKLKYIPNHDVNTLILPNVLDRMRKKYNKFSKALDNKEKNFDTHVLAVYLRYNTFDAYSQCWTAHNKDKPNYKNKHFKTIELFGAPFNTNTDIFTFGSLFPDVDSAFGGFHNYRNLFTYIMDENSRGNYYNIQISPPNVPIILVDLVDKIQNLKKKNNLLIMFPHWTDSPAYQAVSKMFPNQKVIERYYDMWSERVVTGKSIKSTLFW